MAELASAFHSPTLIRWKICNLAKNTVLDSFEQLIPSRTACGLGSSSMTDFILT